MSTTRHDDDPQHQQSRQRRQGQRRNRGRPTPQAAERGRHVGPVAAQTQHIQAARGNPQLRASANQGRPPIAATERPGAFNDHAVAAREAGAPYHPPADRGGGNTRPGGAENNRPEAGGSRAAAPTHVKDLPPMERPTAPNTGNSNLDKKYQQQQEKLSAKQDQERQKLQQRQEQDHQRMGQPSANNARTQQLEQKHQQQTQQLQQKHQAQQQSLQSRQSAPAKPHR